MTVLFTQSNSNYALLGHNCFDEKRNALTFQGSEPVIAHPPCRLFSRLRRFSTAPGCERLLFSFALAVVRQNGGVLEHPAQSNAWQIFNLPLPGRGVDNFGGYSVQVSMHQFGAAFKKNTWLYIVGCPMSDAELALELIPGKKTFLFH